MPEWQETFQWDSLNWPFCNSHVSRHGVAQKTSQQRCSTAERSRHILHWHKSCAEIPFITEFKSSVDVCRFLLSQWLLNGQDGSGILCWTQNRQRNFFCEISELHTLGCHLSHDGGNRHRHCNEPVRAVIPPASPAGLGLLPPARALDGNLAIARSMPVIYQTDPRPNPIPNQNHKP